jgi:hypothetical protein
LADLHQKLAKAQNTVALTKVLPPTVKEKDAVTAAQKASTLYSYRRVPTHYIHFSKRRKRRRRRKIIN